MQVTPLFRQTQTLLTVVRDNLLLVLLPIVLLPGLAACYAAFRPPAWKASQALLVREQAGATERGRGRFDSADAMKTAQETILEIARHRKVVTAALMEVGPPPAPTDHAAAGSGAPQRDHWPSAVDIERLSKDLSVSAPKGSEFGRTEVIYLSVKARQRERAIQLATAVCDHLDARLKEVRNETVLGVIRELEKKRSLCQQALDASIATLESMERGVGSDLGELRILNEQASGDSNLRSASNQIKHELRQARARHAAREKQREFLHAAREDPDRIFATPNDLLQSQAALRRLKDGLVDAQLRTAQLQGTMSDSHPRVRAAKIAEDEVRRELHGELRIALRGVEADLLVSQSLVASLKQQLDDVDKRLDRLAGLRARYSNLVADVKHKTEILEKVAKELASESFRQSAASTTSLLTRLESPYTGNRPSGPGKTTIMLAGLGGGLLGSAGLLFLLTPMSDGQIRGRRFTDQLWGRRRDDRSGGERETSDGTHRRETDRSTDRRIEAAAADTEPSVERHESDDRVTAVDSEPNQPNQPNEQELVVCPDETTSSEQTDYHEDSRERRASARRGEVDRRFGDDRRNS